VKEALVTHSHQRRDFIATAGALVGAGITGTNAQGGGTMTRIDFERATYTAGLTGSGPPPRWTLIEDGGRKVLAETSKDTTDYRFALAIFDQPVAADIDVAVRFKPVSGEVDRAAGLAVRLADASNYYVVRANAAEDNVRLYKVAAGQRRQFAGANIKVPTGVWQELRLVARGSRFEVSLNGKSLYSATDTTFTAAGKVALWTKADSVTYFDDLRIQTP
jgi:hypothetical protein